jgi:hypothetical protein
MQEDIDLINDKAIEMQNEIDSAEDIEDDDMTNQTKTSTIIYPKWHSTLVLSFCLSCK